MNPELEKDSLQAFEKLSHNINFYNNVFKKTEKIVSVIFYIISHIEDNKRTEVHTSQLSKIALETHQIALKSLGLYEHEAKNGLEELIMNLVALEGTIQIASAGGVLSQDLQQLLLNEIDAVQRTIKNHFTKTETPITLGPVLQQAHGQNTQSSPSARRRRASVPQNDLSTSAKGVYQSLPDRAERIKTVLEAAGEASIKDISNIVTDCSEKTIQRQLNSLIENGLVKRVGERRWSRYSLV